MENITHSLMGATLAELALPAGASTPQRRLFFTVGVIAANLPDADLIYTRITPPPLGYLLHHRGHTHTLVGLVPLALLIGAVCLLPRIREYAAPIRSRLWALITAALLSHIVLDSWNIYGVHPFWPIDSRWYYGDVINIFEPWLWVLLGVATVVNTQKVRSRVTVGGGLALFATLLVVFGMIPVTALVVLVVLAAAYAVLIRAWPPHKAAGTALALTALFVVAMLGLNRHVRGQALASIRSTSHGEVIDVMLSPQPANPLCWRATAIASNEQAGEYVMTRGLVAPLTSRACGFADGTQVKWDDPLRQSLAQLRELNRRDCYVRAWMQFGRAPEMGAGTIADHRFGRALRENFTTMQLRPADQAAACPPNLTNWGMPRADLLR